MCQFANPRTVQYSQPTFDHYLNQYLANGLIYVCAGWVYAELGSVKVDMHGSSHDTVQWSHGLNKLLGSDNVNRVSLPSSTCSQQLNCMSQETDCRRVVPHCLSSIRALCRFVIVKGILPTFYHSPDSHLFHCGTRLYFPRWQLGTSSTRQLFIHLSTLS